MNITAVRTVSDNARLVTDSGLKILKILYERITNADPTEAQT